MPAGRIRFTDKRWTKASCTMREPVVVDGLIHTVVLCLDEQSKRSKTLKKEQFGASNMLLRRPLGKVGIGPAYLFRHARNPRLRELSTSRCSQALGV